MSLRLSLQLWWHGLIRSAVQPMSCSAPKEHFVHGLRLTTRIFYSEGYSEYVPLLALGKIFRLCWTLRQLALKNDTTEKVIQLTHSN